MQMIPIGSIKMRKQQPTQLSCPEVTLEEVNRLLEVGRILAQVLTPEELEWLISEFHGSDCFEIGNASVT